MLTSTSKADWGTAFNTASTSRSWEQRQSLAMQGGRPLPRDKSGRREAQTGNALCMHGPASGWQRIHSHHTRQDTVGVTAVSPSLCCTCGCSGAFYQISEDSGAAPGRLLPWLLILQEFGSTVGQDYQIYPLPSDHPTRQRVRQMAAGNPSNARTNEARPIGVTAGA